MHHFVSRMIMAILTSENNFFRLIKLKKSLLFIFFSIYVFSLNFFLRDKKKILFLIFLFSLPFMFKTQS